MAQKCAVCFRGTRPLKHRWKEARSRLRASVTSGPHGLEVGLYLGFAPVHFGPSCLYLGGLTMQGTTSNI